MVYFLLLFVSTTACTQASLEAQVLDGALPLPTIQNVALSAEYEIALLVDVTGERAKIADLTIRAARHAVEEINFRQGGIDGRTLELIVLDSSASAALSTPIKLSANHIIVDDLHWLTLPATERIDPILSDSFSRRFKLQPDIDAVWAYDAVHHLADVWRDAPDAAGSTLAELLQARFDDDARLP